MITVITKTNCPQCRMVKMFLKRNGFTFEEHNVNLEPEYIQKVHAKGFSSVPLLEYQDQLIHGFDIKRLNQLALVLQK